MNDINVCIIHSHNLQFYKPAIFKEIYSDMSISEMNIRDMIISDNNNNTNNRCKFRGGRQAYGDLPLTLLYTLRYEY